MQLKAKLTAFFSFSFLNFADKSQETSAGIPWFLKPILLHFNPIFLLSVPYLVHLYYTLATKSPANI